MSVEDESYAKLTVGGLEELSTLNERKVLGQNWDTVNDTFIHKLDLLANFTKDLTLLPMGGIFIPHHHSISCHSETT